MSNHSKTLLSRNFFHSLCVVICLSGMGCKTNMPDDSQTASVEIKYSSTKSQGKSNFCWAYASISFIEGELFKKTGQMFDLSEEALGFYRIAEELEWMSKRYKASELADAESVKTKSFEYLQGWAFDFKAANLPDLDLPTTYQLIHKYGLIPEEAWSYKFHDAPQTERFFQKIYEKFARVMQTYGQGRVSKDAIQDLLAAKDLFGSRPPREFALSQSKGNSKNVSAVDFVRSYLGFRPEDYRFLIPGEKIGYNEMVEAIKLTLGRRQAVVIGFDTYFVPSRTEDSLYTLGTLDPNSLVFKAGHAALITDFVNQGDIPGSMDSATFQKAMDRPAADLDFLVLRDSFRSKALSPKIGKLGYLPMDQNYLRYLTAHAKRVGIMVPTDVVRLTSKKK